MLNQAAGEAVEQKVVAPPPPVDPVVKRVETYFSKVNPPEKAFVEMFMLPREKFQKALFGFLELTWPDEKSVHSVKFAHEFVQSMAKKQLKPLSDEDFKKYQELLSKLSEEVETNDRYLRLHLLDQEFQALESLLEQNAEFIDNQRLKTVEKLRADELDVFKRQNCFSTGMISAFDLFPAKIREFAAQLAKQKLNKPFTGAWFRVVYEIVQNFTFIQLPVVLNIPRDYQSLDYRQNIRVYIIRNFRQIEKQIIESLLGSVKIDESLFEGYSAEKPLLTGTMYESKTVGQQLLIVMLMGVIAQYQVEQSERVISDDERQKILVLPGFQGAANMRVEPVYAKLRAK